MILRSAFVCVGVFGVLAMGCAEVRFDDDKESDSDESGDGTPDKPKQPSPDPGDEPPVWTASCPSVSELDAFDSGTLAVCDGDPTDGTFTLQNAEDLLYRVVHESAHISSLIANPNPGWLLGPNGEFSGLTDHGFMIGTFSDETPVDEGAACAVVEFGCWTGGHGGFGPSALAGLAMIEVTLSSDAVAHVRIASDALWLVESGALSGTPQAAVAVALTVVDGEVAATVATIGEHQIER